MQEKSKLVITDTSCLILLSKIGELDILKSMFDKIQITSIIANEYSQNLPDWIEIINNNDDKFINLISTELDIGEASAFALYLNSQSSVLVIDDLKGRNFAKKINANYIGTIGLILKAIQNGIIKDKKRLVEKIKSTNFRISQEILDLF